MFWTLKSKEVEKKSFQKLNFPNFLIFTKFTKFTEITEFPQFTESRRKTLSSINQDHKTDNKVVAERG